MSGNLRLVHPKVEVIGDRQPRATGGIAIEEPTAPDPSAVSVEVDDDGTVNIDIGGTGQDAAPKPRNTTFDANLAEDMDSMALAAIASALLDGIDADLQSRKDWEDTANKAARYLGIKLEDPGSSTSADGTVCRTISTVLLESLVKLWGVARAELLPVGGPVKVRSDKTPTPKPPAPPPGGIAPGAAPAGGIAPPAMGDNGGPPLDDAPDDDDLAQALETDLNHYLTVTDKEYYPDFSKMLLNRGLIGMAFRKVFRCPLRRRPASVWVKAQDLIVSNDCSHLSGAGRVTERIKMRQSTMRRMMVGGHYRDVVLAQPTGQTTDAEESVADIEGVDPTPQLPNDYEHLVYECCCELGSGTAGQLMGELSMLDEDETGAKPGYPLPYRVSIDLDSREVLEIRRNWKQGDQDHRARQRYVKYGFVPGLGFYDLGLIHMVGNPTQAATMIQRATVDSALFANFPGGMILDGPVGAQQNTVFRANPGEYVRVKAVNSLGLDQIVKPFPYREPGAAIMALGEKMEGDVRKMAGVIDIPVGEGMGQTPVGTIMSYIEAISQVPGAVHKDDHIAQQEEFELLRELISEEPEVLTRGVRRPARQWQIAQEIMDPELVPAADPNTPSQIHRLMKVQGMVAIGGLPQFGGIADNRKIYAKAMAVLAGDADDYTMPPQTPQPPPPDPRVVAAQIKAQSQQQSDAAGMQKDAQDHQEKMAEIAQEGQQREADRQSAEVRAAMTVDAATVKAGADSASAAADRAHDTMNQIADRAQDHAHHMAGQQQGIAPPGAAPQPAVAPLSAPNPDGSF